MSEHIPVARKTLAFGGGETSIKKMSLTEKPLTSEDEETFTQRLLRKYGKRRGTIELVLKNGYPDYAIITLD